MDHRPVLPVACLSEDQLERVAVGVSDPSSSSHVVDCRSCGDRLTSWQQQQQSRTKPVEVHASLKEAAPPLQAGARLGHYVVLGTLGEGGMGVVYRAYDRELDRNVAIKLVSPKTGGSVPAYMARARLVREAQAMAKLSHPNVVPVFEVGEEDGHVFLVMEYVKGETLRSWLQAAERPWREVLEKFLRAGQGLSAAHDAGLVHRDFKPANVLVSVDGQVKVTDFGLVRATQKVEEQTAWEYLNNHETPADASITRPGAVVGTTGYISPEQLKGQDADAKSDQFSFCVSLYWALYRTKPYPAEGIEEYSHRLQQPPQRPPPDSKVPKRLWKVLERGLAVDPAQRFGSMRELLEQLGTDWTGRRSRLVLGLTLVALATGALAAGLWRARDTSCEDSRGRLQGVWDPQVRQKLERHFGEAGRAVVFSEVARRLDLFSSGWVSSREAICAERTAKGAEHTALFHLRITCLDQRLEQVRTLAGILVQADAQTLSQGAVAAANLASASSCEHATALEASAEPIDPEQRALLARLRIALLHAKVDADLAHCQEALARVRASAADLKRLDNPSLEAEFAFVEGDCLHTRDAAASERAYAHAHELALRAHNDSMATHTAAKLAMLIGYLDGKVEEGRSWLRIAETLASRGEVSRLALSELQNTRLAFLAYVPPIDLDRAIQAAEEGVRVSEGLGTKENRALGNLADIYFEAGKDEEAYRLGRQANRLDQKLRPFEPNLAVSMMNLTEIALARGDLSQARTYAEEAVRFSRGHSGGSTRATPGALYVLGRVLLADGQVELARQRLDEAKATAEGGRGYLNSEDASWVRLFRAAVGLRRGQADAMNELSAALADQEKLYGKESPNLSLVLLTLGEAHLGAGRPRSAIPLLERALEVRMKGRTNRFTRVGDIEFALARALAAAHQDLPRARGLAAHALQSFGDSPLFKPRQLAIEEWLTRTTLK